MIYAIAILLNSSIPQTKLVAVMGMIEYIQCDRLVMVVIRGLDIEKLKTSGEEILIRAVVEHDRLICQLFTTNTLLPLRFGTAFKSQILLEAYLQTNHLELITKLEKLKGYSEYLLTLTLLEIDSKIEQTQALKGKDYLLAKRSHYLAEQARRSQQQQECQDLMALLPSPTQVVTPQSGEFLRVYFLATSLEMDQFDPVFSQWQSQYSHWQLELSSPLPPYHFCD